MTATEIWAEELPLHLRVGDWEGLRWAAVEREQSSSLTAGRVVWIHVPETADEKAMGPERFAAKKAAKLGVPLVPVPEGMVWLEPGEGVWVLMPERRGRRARGVPTAKRPKPDAAPGFYWPDRVGTRVVSA